MEKRLGGFGINLDIREHRMHNANNIIQDDMRSILESLSQQEISRLTGKTFLLTGCAGFLGHHFLHFLCQYAEELDVRKIIALDNFLIDRPAWLQKLADSTSKLEIMEFDIRNSNLDSIPGAASADYILHMASVASPTYYRQYPLETFEANLLGLRNLLEFYKSRPISGILYFSSSEIYGDPTPDQIPTSEEYRGNVATMGPRACYDEAKRSCETLSYLYAQQYSLPITLVRPFNNYGPGMRLGDKRVPADFASAVLENRDIEIFSDGRPTRTFCYISDAISGYMKALLLGKFDYFNIGIETPEISVAQLAEIYRQVGVRLTGYQGTVRLSPPPEDDYLTHNPNRRCPDIAKARNTLGYQPKIGVEEGVERFLQFLVQHQ